jgi:hypothetical protein
MKELLKSTAGREDLLDLTREDLAYALLRCMQERRDDPIHPVNRDSAVSELFSITDPISPMERRALERKLNAAFRKAFEQLESWELIEPAEGENGKNGYIVLTKKGGQLGTAGRLRESAATATASGRDVAPRVARRRAYGLSRRQIWQGGLWRLQDCGGQVRKAAHLSEAEHGGVLMQIAFNEKNGPLTDPNESPAQQKAVRMLFEGALGRFRNPEGHTNRVFADSMEPMQELMLASRLLTLLEGRPVSGAGSKSRKS